MKNRRLFFTIVSIVCFFSSFNSAMGNEISVVNQQDTVTQLKAQTTLPVFVPVKIPNLTDQKHLYVSFSGNADKNPDYNQFWQINWDATPSCHGVRVCNIGFISAEKNGHLDKTYVTLPGNEKHLKEKIKLKNNVIAYYTPFHIQAGGVNPTVEWRVNNILYTLSWKISANAAQQKHLLIQMVPIL